MALTMDWPLPAAGLTIPGAYLRVSDYQGGKAHFLATVKVYRDAGHAAEAAADPAVAPADAVQVQVPWVDATNAIAATYLHLKALPAYAAAADI